jgi:hypothetical protein
VGGWIAAQFEEGNRSDSSGERDRSNHFAEGIVGVLVSPLEPARFAGEILGAPVLRS